ncbi:chemotaxis protein CheW [Sphingomonas sp.]|uniref:chemotaxis protein CheW n=1 Tax=Sphingomonas sp. TaxID=28214 RepID=UPI003B00DACA
MDDLKLVARLGGQLVALPAAAIESVVELDQITPAPLASRHVAGLAPLRSRVLTVIDSYVAIGEAPADAEGARQAVVVTIDGHSYGLLVDEVEDVVALDCEIMPLPAGLGRGWAAAAIGLIELDGQGALLVDPARLVGGGTALEAA